MTDPTHPVLRDIVTLIPGLEDVAAGRPNETLLAAAPRLSDWNPILRRCLLALRGHAPDHPILEGTAMVTSQALWIDTVRGVVRTRSRWYRLGPRAVAHGLGRLPRWFHGRPIPDRIFADLLDAQPENLQLVCRDLGDMDLVRRLEQIAARWLGSILRSAATGSGS